MPTSQVAPSDAGAAGASLHARPTGALALPRRLAGLYARFRRVENGGPQPLPAWVHIGVLAVIGAVTFYLARGLWGWTYDDVFIIFRYARNFADGLGMVYNPGEAYLGTSSIGYTLLLAAMHLVAPGVDFLVLGSIVSALGCFAMGALFWLIGVQGRTPLAGALAGLLAIADPVLVEVWGGEMYLLTPLVLAAILAYARGKGTLTAVLLSLAVLTRQDSLVLVGVIAAHYLLEKRRVAVGPVVVFVALLLPWAAYSWVFFGSPLPGTLDAKIAQGQAGWPFFLSGSLQWMSERLGPGPIRLLAFALMGAGLLALVVRWARKPVGPWVLFFAWSALFTAGYTVLRVAFYGWYAVPAATGLLALLAWGTAGVTEGVAFGARALASRVRAASAWAVSAAVVVPAVAVFFLLAYPVGGRALAFMNNYITYHRQSDLYKRAGEWLRDHGGPAVSVAYLEVGEIGYYSGSRVIDLLGLVTPGASAHVPSWDYGWALQRYRPDFYLANSRFNGLLQNIQQEAWFARAYEKVGTLDDTMRGPVPQPQKMAIYHLKRGAELPAPLRPVVAQRISQQPLWLNPSAPRIGQTFVMPEANLSAIALLVAKPEGAETGSLVLHLRSAPAEAGDLRQAAAPLADIVNNGWYTFRFDPLPDSAGKTYYFTLDLSGAPPRQPPPAFWIATDDLYRAGARFEGTKPSTGDFCMRVSVPDRP